VYRKDISHVLRLLAFVLVLFLAYQMWLKPTYFSPVPVPLPQPPPETASFPPPSDPNQPLSQEHGRWNEPQTRLLDLGQAPNSTVGSIREELERGNYAETERYLRPLPEKMLANTQVRKYVAALWNNLGIQQEKFGGIEVSVKAFKRAVALDPSNPIAHLNLTQAYWGLRDPAMTPQFLERVIHLSPQDPFPHLALADLLLEKGNVTLAATHLSQARTRAETDATLRPYLKKLTAKVESATPASQSVASVISSPKLAAPAPSPKDSPLPPSVATPANQAIPVNVSPSERGPRQLAPPETGHFTVQFDGSPDQATWTRMKAILDYAYEEITQKFGHVPSKPMTVVLHTNQKFAGPSGSPVWADTLFDHTSGAIHIPTQGALEDLALFSRIVRHEFVHALLFEYLKGRSTMAPTWLIEGLAMHLAEDPWSDVEEAKQHSAALIPLTSLQGAWEKLPSESVLTAFLEASSATQLLLDSYSLYNVRQVMSALLEGRSLDAAMQQKLSMPYEQFQRQWEKTSKQPSSG
jgi:tetratricopeptide (TPR) repeat protein